VATMNISDALAANAVWRKDHDAMRLALEALEGSRLIAMTYLSVLHDLSPMSSMWGVEAAMVEQNRAIDALKERLLEE